VVWSLVALFVLFSVWGLTRILCNTLLGEAECGSREAGSSANFYDPRLDGQWQP
jgi:hypothetical protein